MIYKRINKKLKLATVGKNFHILIKKDKELDHIIYGATRNKELQGKIVLEQNAKVNFYLLLWQCQNLTTKLDFILSGQGARAQINILALAGNQDKHNFDLQLQHQNKNIYSRLNLKRILWQQADSYSQESLKINKNADGADAHLSDRIILMGNNSKVIGQPILEILNNNVQASHSAASGRLSEPEIFYLQSRGLDEPRAKSLLLDSFIKEVLPSDKKISSLIKQQLSLYVKSR